MRDPKDLHLDRMRVAVKARIATMSKQVLEAKIRLAHLEDALTAEKKLETALEERNG